MSEDDQEFDARAEEHGFSDLQAEFLRTYLSRPGHDHTADQIVDLDDAVSEILDEDLDEEDD